MLNKMADRKEEEEEAAANIVTIFGRFLSRFLQPLLLIFTIGNRTRVQGQHHQHQRRRRVRQRDACAVCSQETPTCSTKTNKWRS